MMNEDNRLLLDDIEKSIRRLIFTYMIIGRFPLDWSFEAYNQYIANHGLILKCYLFWPKSKVNDDVLRINVSRQIEEVFPSVCARCYDNFIVCLSFEKHDQIAVTKEEILEIIVNNTSVSSAKSYESPQISDLWQMVSAYNKLCADAVKDTECEDYDGRTIRLYALESELLDSTLENDQESIRTALEEIAELSDSLNSHNWVKERSYFCFLWRYIDRAIFQKQGKHATLDEKITIDADLQSAEGLNEAVDILYAFINATSKALGIGLENDRVSNYHRLIEMAKKIVIANCSGDVSLENIARELGLSSFYLSKLFKKEEGINYKDFVISVRMEKAKELIHEGKLNVNEVAIAVGYNNNTYFGKAFKNYFGITAKDMRLHRID